MVKKELRLIEQAKTLYNIDFSDDKRLILHMEQEELQQAKDQLMKKINIMESSVSAVQKSYQTQHKSSLKAMSEQHEKQKLLKAELEMLTAAVQSKQDACNSKVQEGKLKMRPPHSLTAIVQQKTLKIGNIIRYKDLNKSEVIV